MKAAGIESPGQATHTDVPGADVHTKAITIFGSAQPHPGSALYEQARRLGRLLAKRGFAVVNGGYSGTMQASSQGATEGGGQAVGITCAIFDDRRSGGNPYLSHEIHTADLLARLRQLTERCDGFVVLDGGVGTLLELLLVWNLLAVGVIDKPCILVGAHWRQVLRDLKRQTQVNSQLCALLSVTDSVEDAVQLLDASLGR